MNNTTGFSAVRSGSVRVGAVAALIMLMSAPLSPVFGAQSSATKGVSYTAQRLESADAYEAIVAIGQQQLDARAYESALATFEGAIAQYPDAARLFVGKGESLYGLGQFAAAAAAFKTATEQSPDYLYAWVWLGNAYDDNQQLDLALDSYSTASRLDATNPMPYYHRGIALWYAKRDAEAEADFRKVVRSVPDFSSAWMWLGRSLGQQAQYEDALSAFDQALTLAPGQLGAVFGRGRSLLELGRFAESVKAFDIYLLDDSASAQAWFYRGNGLLGLAQYEDASASYEQSLAIDPNEGTFYNQGLALTNLERYDEAIASFEQAIALNPENEDARKQVETLKQLKAQAKLAVALY